MFVRNKSNGEEIVIVDASCKGQMNQMHTIGFFAPQPHAGFAWFCTFQRELSSEYLAAHLSHESSASDPVRGGSWFASIVGT